MWRAVPKKKKLRVHLLHRVCRTQLIETESASGVCKLDGWASNSLVIYFWNQELDANVKSFSQAGDSTLGLGGSPTGGRVVFLEAVSEDCQLEAEEGGPAHRTPKGRKLTHQIKYRLIFYDRREKKTGNSFAFWLVYGESTFRTCLALSNSAGSETSCGSLRFVE